MAASVEEAEGDAVVGGTEPVGDPGEQADLGVHALAVNPLERPWVSEAMIPARCRLMRW